MTEKIQKWIDFQKALVREEFEGYGYHKDVLEGVVEREQDNVDVFANLIINAIKTKEEHSLRELFPFMENNAKNRRTAFLFGELTGINPGRTNKSGVDAFIKYFGDAIPNTIFNDRKVESEKQKEQEASNKLSKLKDASGIAFEYLQTLNGRKAGSARKTLNVLVNYDEFGILSRMNFINNLIMSGEKVDTYEKESYREDPDNRFADEIKEIKQMYSISCSDDDSYDITKTEFEFGFYLQNSLSHGEVA